MNTRRLHFDLMTDELVIGTPRRIFFIVRPIGTIRDLLHVFPKQLYQLYNRFARSDRMGMRL